MDTNAPLGETEAARESTKKNARTQQTSSLESRLYTVAAERRHQRKTTDLIPKRKVAVAVILAIALLLVAGINLLAIYSPSWESAIGQSGVRALKIWGPGTIASWIASVCWFTSAAICAQIFVLRRHRNDDYEGTYRVWGWLAVCSLLCSAMCTVDISGLLFQLVGWLTSVSLFQPAWLIPSVVSVLVGLMVIRALFEVRGSYGTVAWYTMAWIAWSVSTVASVGSNGSQAELAGTTWLGMSTAIVSGNGWLLAAICALLGKLNYARYVFLRANGLVKPVVKSEAMSIEADSEEVTPATESTTNQPAAKRKRSPKTTKPTSGTKANATTKKSAQPTEATEVKSKPAIRTRVESKPAPVEVENEPASIPLQVISASDPEPTSSAPSTGMSASEKLRQLAEASRAKQQTQVVDSAESDEPSVAGSKKMSKADKRRMRKAQRKAKRAA